MRILFASFVFLSVLAASPARAANIEVDIPSQRMKVRTAAGELLVWPVSTAARGFVTPTGVYRPYQLQKMHYSKKYNMAPMPHSIFFHEGYAIHGASAVGQLGRPASHGCIRLAPAHAARLFSIVKLEGAAITIHDAASRAKADAAFVQALATAPLRTDEAAAPARDGWALRASSP